MNFAFYNPTRLVFGDGRFHELSELAAGLGNRALLVTGRSAMQKTGHLDSAVEMLEQAGARVTVFDHIPPNPTLEAIEDGGRLARETDCDFIVGLGGGSAMDSAKAIAVAATHDCNLREFLLPGENGVKRQPTDDTLPVVAITSTAGTSSELTPFAVITMSDTCEKSAMGGPALYQRVAIADPQLTRSLPPRITASTGMDVMCHALEGYVSTVANPMTDVLALRAIELVALHLPHAVADGGDDGARRGMMLANCLAGYVLSQNGTNLMHALEHPMSGRYPDLPHGEGLCAVLSAWAELMAERQPDRLAAVARRIGVQEADDVQAAAHTAEALSQLLAQVGMDLRLSQLGVEPHMLDTLADDALRYMHHALAKTPGQVTCEHLTDILQASY